ncbi:hypothetical protein [Novosphingobium sp.]|uniref:hypothetical protein n=1 Tax=Novosphingobium sp. TaxID=1874826 RepID=UPI003BAC1F7F
MVFLIAGQALCLFCLWVLARRDFVRLTRPALRVEGVVAGYRSIWDEGACSYAPVYRFTSEGGEHEVIEAIYGPVKKPAVGTGVSLCHPAGRPDLAQVPRPLLWLAVYALLAGLDAVLLAKMLGWLPE